MSFDEKVPQQYDMAIKLSQLETENNVVNMGMKFLEQTPEFYQVHVKRSSNLLTKILEKSLLQVEFYMDNDVI